MAAIWIAKLISLIPIGLIVGCIIKGYSTGTDGLGSLWHGNFGLMFSGRSTIMMSLLGMVLGPLIITSPFSNRSTYYLKMAAYFVGMVIASFAGIVAGLAFPIFKPSWRKNIQWLVARVFYNLISPVVGCDVVIEGEEYLEPCYRGEPHVLVANHQSVLDIMFLSSIFPRSCVVMAKKEIKWTPIVGQYLALSRAVFIDRKHRSSASQSLQTAAEDMRRHGLSLFIFPEGTRLYSATPDLLPFKVGAFKLASGSDLKVIPIICENYWNLFNSKFQVFHSGRIFIKVFGPMKVKEGETVEEFANRVRKVMLDGLIEFSHRQGSVSCATVTPASSSQ